MTRSEADRLALHVKRATGADVTVEPNEGEFVVVVRVEPQRPDVVRDEFTLFEDDDWEWFRDRILGT